MSIARANLDEVSEADLNALIQTERPEGLEIEYKRDPYGSSHADKKEALKDITSFANSVGGHLIIGMEAKDGIPTKLRSLPLAECDSLINRLEALVRDGVEPRVVGIRMRAVSVRDSGAVIVIRIPRSWNPPHRVTTSGTSRFYVRNSAGAHEASVEELRVLFTLAGDAHERIRTFRSERIKTVAAGYGPVQLPANGRVFVHVVPLSAFGQPNEIDLERAHANAHAHFLPMAPTDMTLRFNLDGLINIRGGRSGYTQIFRNGILEAARADILSSRGDETVLRPGRATGNVIDMIPSYFRGLQELEVPTPVVLMVSYEGVGGAKLEISSSEYDLDEIEPFPSVEPLLLPEAIINDYGSPEDYVRALRPIFDTLWNAAGLARCTYYDAEGNWKPPK